MGTHIYMMESMWVCLLIRACVVWATVQTSPSATRPLLNHLAAMLGSCSVMLGYLVAIFGPTLGSCWAIWRLCRAHVAVGLLRHTIKHI